MCYFVPQPKNVKERCRKEATSSENRSTYDKHVFRLGPWKHPEQWVQASVGNHAIDRCKANVRLELTYLEFHVHKAYWNRHSGICNSKLN